MEILKTGEKIKKLRKELGLKQDDITNEEVTRSLISMIENNKRALSWQTANIIADCLNQYYKNIGRTISPEFLMETEVDQARNIIIAQIKIIEASLRSKNVNHVHLHQSIEWLMELATEWDIRKEMADLLKLRGEVYYYSFQYNEALKDYSDSLEYNLSVKDLEQVARIYNLVGKCYHMLGLTEQALMYYLKSNEMVIEHKTSNKDTMKLFTIFNIIICYRKLKKYDMVFQYIKLFKNLAYYDDNSYDEVLLMEANTYRDLKNYEKAEKIYEKLVNRLERLDPNTLFLLYDNYVILYREKGDMEKALYYINEAFKMEDRIKPTHLTGLYQEKAKSLILFGKYDEAVATLEKGLEIAERVAEIETIIDFNFAFAEIHMSHYKNYDVAKGYLNKAEDLIISKNIKSKLDELYSRYAELYCNLGETQQCIEFIIKLQSNRMS